MLKRKIFLWGGLLLLMGCAKLAHIDELLTLQELSIDQDKQAKFVQEQDKKFESLLAAIQSDSFRRYTDQKSFLKDFGPPVTKQTITKENQLLEKWVYRYATKAFNSEKVYVYFDQSGKLMEWEHIKPQRKEGEG